MFSRTSLEVQLLRFHSQCWGPRFNPWSGNKISHAATKKKKKTKAESGAHLIFRSLVQVLMRTQRIWDFGWLSPLCSRCSSAQSNSAFSGGGPVLCAQDKMKTDSSHIPVKPSVLPDFFLDSWPTLWVLEYLPSLILGCSLLFVLC